MRCILTYYRTRAIISRSLYTFYPIFHCSQEQTFAEVEADDIFPELLKELPSVALSLAFKCHDSKRYEVHSDLLPYVRHHMPRLVYFLPHFSLRFIV